MSEPKFVDGLYPKPKNPSAPDFVIGKLSINLEQFMPWIRQWCKDNPGEKWVNIEMVTRKNDPSKGSAKLDEWKPEQQQAAPEPAPIADDDSEIPF